MAKKIYDIKPPKIAKEAKEPKVTSAHVRIKRTVRKASVAPTGAVLTEKNITSETVGETKKKRSILLPIFISIFVLLIAIAGYLFFKLPKADIAIWPKVDILAYKQTLTADKLVNEIDVAKAVIPAQYFEATATNAQDFPATGNASNEGYAGGSITIYNKYIPAMPFTFKAGTRFMSDSGKIFVTFQKVVVPAASKVGSKVTPGSVKINIQEIGRAHV
jgi:hypothetical protein